MFFRDMRIVFPDPLTWQSGIEFGLQALGKLHRGGVPFKFSLCAQGPMLEAATFAVIQHQMQNQVRWVRRWPQSFREFDVAVFPRVIAMETSAISEIAAQGMTVVSSDPEFRESKATFHQFARRDSDSLANILINLRLPGVDLKNDARN